MNIKAIPTRYNGVQFRSRLEAKWAAFFDLIGWKWEYEPFDFSSDSAIPPVHYGVSWIPQFGYALSRNHLGFADDINRAWREAGNRVQWRAP